MSHREDSYRVRGKRRIPLILIGAAVLAATVTGGVVFLESSAPAVTAANVSLYLYGYSTRGWSTTPGAETNPGPTITVNQNDHITVTLTSEDMAYHGLLIDYDNSSTVDAGDFFGPTTTYPTYTVVFTLDATQAGSFWYYCHVHSGPPYSWNTSAMRGRWIVNAAPPDTTPPTITNAVATPSVQETGSSVTISADVTDNVAVASVKAHVVGPSTDVNLTMTNVGGPAWNTARTYTATGAYNFTVWALDPSGNPASKNGSFTIRDRTSPAIASVAATPAIAAPGSPVNISATVTDNGVLASVKAHVLGPYFDMNLTMAVASGSTWFVNRAYTYLGSYSFTIWATDAAGNVASKSGSFTISTAVVPPAPASATATALTNGTIRMTWSAVSDPSVTGYNVYRSTYASGPFTKLTATPIPGSGTLVYFDGDVQAGVTYYYVVRSVNTANNESPDSPVASAAVLASSPPLTADYTVWIGIGILLLVIAAVAILLLVRRRRV